MTDKHVTSSKHTLSEDDLDALLGDVDFLEVPSGFTSKVMQDIDALPDYRSDRNGASESGSEATQHKPSKQSEWWHWAALIGGGIPAFLQVLAFIFSAWNVANLG